MKKKWLGGKGPFVTAVIFLVLGVIIAFNFYYQSREFSPDAITKDLAMLQTIFKKIDDHARIVSFDAKKVVINFLNVGCFEGRGVGAMNLAYPKQWQGPYLEKNPSIQNIEYEIVQTKKGFFIVPGTGVILPNRKIMGKDIVIDENSDIQAMMNDENALMYKGIALAAQLKVGFSEWQKILFEGYPEGMM